MSVFVLVINKNPKKQYQNLKIHYEFYNTENVYVDEPRVAHDEVDDIEEAKWRDYPGNSYNNK